MATKIRGRQIETDDFIKSVRNSDIDWTDDTATASQKAIAQLVGSSTPNDKNFEYTWVTPTLTITISHNLNKNPAVSVVDTANSEIVCDVDYIDTNNVKLTFSAATRGTAYFN